MPTVVSAREFNQDTGRAKDAAHAGPVIITDRGKPSHVLLTYEAYQRLRGRLPSIVDLLAMPAGKVVEFEPERSRELTRAASLD